MAAPNNQTRAADQDAALHAQAQVKSMTDIIMRAAVKAYIDNTGDFEALDTAIDEVLKWTFINKVMNETQLPTLFEAARTAEEPGRLRAQQAIRNAQCACIVMCKHFSSKETNASEKFTNGMQCPLGFTRFASGGSAGAADGMQCPLGFTRVASGGSVGAADGMKCPLGFTRFASGGSAGAADGMKCPLGFTSAARPSGFTHGWTWPTEPVETTE